MLLFLSPSSFEFIDKSRGLLEVSLPKFVRLLSNLKLGNCEKTKAMHSKQNRGDQYVQPDNMEEISINSELLVRIVVSELIIIYQKNKTYIQAFRQLIKETSTFLICNCRRNTFTQNHT